MVDDGRRTGTGEYADLMRARQGGWKERLDVYRPYRWHVRRLAPGRLLDLGCGLGRNLVGHPDAVGVDHNAAAVAVARARGLRAWTSEEWPACPDAVPGSFDALLAAHVLEHLGEEEAHALLEDHLRWLRPTARLLLVCPQEVAFSRDDTHIRWLDVPEMEATARRLGFTPLGSGSFPLPRPVGRVFNGNETWVLAERRPPAANGETGAGPGAAGR